MYIEQTNTTPAANDNSFRSMMSHVRETFRPKPAPLDEAFRIMGKNMHQLNDVIRLYKLGGDFRKDNQQLMYVPYTRSALEWAAAHGGVLTPFCASLRRIVRTARGTVDVPKAVFECNDKSVLGRPGSPRWQLMLRTSTSVREHETLLKQPRWLRQRIDAPSLALLVSCMYIDRELLGESYAAPRSTKDVIRLAGVQKRLVVESSQGLIKVFMAQELSDRMVKPPAVTWKPLRVA